MYRKSMSIIVVLCLLGMGSIAFGGSWGGPWSFQGDWHNTDTTMCKPAYNSPQTNDWYDFNNWGMQLNGCNAQGQNCNGCAVTLFDCYIFLAVESKAPEPCVSTWNPQYPGADANGYDLYATQVFVMPWAWEYAPAGFRMTIEGGNINCGRLLGLAYNVAWPAIWNAYPILDVNGGTVYTPGYRNFDANFPYDPTKWDDPCYPWVVGEGLWVGGGDPGYGENWGIVNIRNTGKIIVPRIRIMNGEVNIFEYGLLYDFNSDPNMFFISQARPRNKINVAGGELRLAGDRLAQVSYYLSKSRLIPCDGHGKLWTDFNGFDTSVTATCTPDSAWNPSPIDGAISVPLNKVLSWSPGPSTLTAGDNNAHAVYFGTDFNEVNDANTSTPVIFKGWQDPCSYNPGALVMDTNYFWRVDEHNDVTVWKGNIWAFKSKGPQATDPIPGNDAEGLPIPIVLKWNPGAKAQGAQAHAVYFGTNQTSVTDASVGNPLGCFKGYVANPVYALSSLDYNLVADTNYYWRIDESDSCTVDPNVWKGEVWHVFNTNYFVAEDFSLYTDNATMYAKWKMGKVDYTTCGEADIHTNGVIDFDFNDVNGQMQFDYDNSYAREFSEVRFDANDGSASGSDWTGGGALPDDNKCRSLSIRFIGNVTNDADPDYDRMYVAIEDTAGNFGARLQSEPQAQKSFEWTQWFINLNDLNDINDVQLAHIKYLYLGFSDRCHDIGFYTAGGTGRIRVDDIRLYQKTCLPQFGQVGDLSGDCKVDYADLDVMANTWAAKQTILPSVTNPGTTGLRLWYKFDETTGITVADSSGHGYDGEVNSAPTFGAIGQPTEFLWDPTGGYDGGGCFVSSPMALADFNMIIDACTAAMSTTQTSVTFSIWINGDTYMPLNGWARLISVTQDLNAVEDDANEVIEIECPIPRPMQGSSNRNWTMFKCGVTGDANSVSTSQNMPLSAFAGSWQHYAFVRAGADGNVPDANYNRIQIYHNGERIADANALRPIFASSTPFDGSLKVEHFRLTATRWDYENYYGKIDDFRVYNRALSAAEIGWLGTKGTGTVPFQNTSNLKVTSPDNISFNDMAMLAKNWLTYQSWPNP